MAEKRKTTSSNKTALIKKLKMEKSEALEEDLKEIVSSPASEEKGNGANEQYTLPRRVNKGAVQQIQPQFKGKLSSGLRYFLDREGALIKDMKVLRNQSIIAIAFWDAIHFRGDSFIVLLDRITLKIKQILNLSGSKNIELHTDPSSTLKNLPRECSSQTRFSVICTMLEMPNGDLAFGMSGGEILIWSWFAGDDGERYVYKNTLDNGDDHAVMSLAVLHNGADLASGSHDGKIRLWDIKTGNCQQVIHSHSHSVTALAVLPSGNLVSGSKDNTVKLWRSNGECKATLVGHQTPVTSITVLPKDPFFFVSTSEDGTVKFWRNECLFSTLDESLLSLTMLSNGRLASSSSDGDLILWDTDKDYEGDFVERYDEMGAGPVHFMTGLDNGRLVTCSTSNNMTAIWE